jgi:predicted AAA+ superfamily ATPase
VLRAFDNYLVEGGYPEVLKQAAALEKKQILQNYYRTIYYRDIIERYNVKAKHILEAAMRYCLDVYADLFSISAFAGHLKAHGLPGSKRTISNYLQYMQEAFFLLLNEKFSYSPRKRLMNPKKVYLLDLGFSFLSTEFSENRGRTLENAVAIELYRRHEEAFYHKGRQECDFIIKHGTKPTAAIQVCWALNKRTEEREAAGLLEAMKEFGIEEGMILTYDQDTTLKRRGHVIAVRPVWKWMLGSEA